MSPAPEVGGAGGLGGGVVGQGDVPGVPPGLRLGVDELGVVLGDRGRDRTLDRGPRTGGQHRRQRRVDLRGRCLRQRVGELGDPAGLERIDLQRLHPAPAAGQPVAQVQGVGDQRPDRVLGQAQGRGQGLGGERRHRRTAIPAQRLLPVQHPRQARGVEGGDPALVGGGVQHAPMTDQPQLVPLRGTDLGPDPGQRRQAGVAVELVELHGLPGRVGDQHESIRSEGTDSPGPRTALAAQAQRNWK